MHFHGYAWVGDKATFDNDALRRLPDRPWATADPEVNAQREAEYRFLLDGFVNSGVPPLETALWLLKSPALILGTWQDPGAATAWLRAQPAEYVGRFASPHDRKPARLASVVASAAETLASGRDVCFGCYLGQPSFLSLSVVGCSPNRARPELGCPQER
ncbi:hypothetical protein NGB36_25145 [Streptomyces sp. RB6PN25]|uniref:Uncharacterized protein n=1 Tax=Streptomyces humicola TaxID=2953240 RepID=A0ABT1Q1I2_9ACTN|nr:hypothetical protein [Streptomyces humicola]MCQ4083789.1 hypothetical protein [Streptomyces humicola]